MIKRNYAVGCGLLVAFVLWTVAVMNIDLQAVGPQGSVVGFAGINMVFHNLTGEHLWIYVLTDWLSLIPAFGVIGLGLLGFVQLVTRRNLFKVDMDILALGVYYVVVLGLYLFFEEFVVNYRPMLIEGVLEVSYPSSTTLLVLSVMPTVMMQAKRRLANRNLAGVVNKLLGVFTAFMVIGRLICGVHWLTDIIGGTLLAAGLVIIYRTTLKVIDRNKRRLKIR